MDTSGLVIGGVVVLVVGRQLRATFLEQLHSDRPTTRGELAQLVAIAASSTPLAPVGAVVSSKESDDTSPKTRAHWTDRVRGLVSVAVRLAFFVWLYDVTDGAAFGPLAFAENAFGGTVWQTVLIGLGLSEVVARLAALAFRFRRRATSQPDRPSIP